MSRARTGDRRYANSAGMESDAHARARRNLFDSDGVMCVSRASARALVTKLFRNGTLWRKTEEHYFLWPRLASNQLLVYANQQSVI